MVGKFRFEPCPSCCECPEWEDGFDRANSSDLGADWTEIAGDSFIESNRLKCTYSGGKSSLVICEQKPQGDKISNYIEVSLGSRVENDNHRVILNYEDENNYFFIEVICGAFPTQGTLTFYRRAGAVDTAIKSVSFTSNPNVRLYICFYAGDPYWIEGVEYRAVRLAVHDATTDLFFGVAGLAFLPPPDDVYRVGLGGGRLVDEVSYPVYFNDFYLSEYWFTNQKCPKCCCWCDRYEMHQVLHLAIEGRGVDGSGETPPHDDTPGCMAAFWDGRGCDLIYNPSFPCSRWEDDGTLIWDPEEPPTCCPNLGQNLNITLHCNGAGEGVVSDFTLEVNGYTLYPNENSTCVPFFLEFSSGDLGPCIWSGDPPPYHNLLIHRVFL